MPLIASVPVQAPLAVQEVALLEDQVSVAHCPSVILVGAAVIVTVGEAAAAGENFVTNTVSGAPEVRVA